MCLACSISTDPSQFVQTMANGAMAISPVLGYAILRVHRIFQATVRTRKAPYVLGVVYALAHSVMSAVIVIMNATAQEQGVSTSTGMMWIIYAIVWCGGIWYMKSRYSWVMQWHAHIIGSIAFAIIGGTAVLARALGQHDVAVRIFLDAMMSMYYVGIGTVVAWVAVAMVFDVWYWWVEKRGGVLK